MAGGRTFLIKLLGDSKGAEDAFKKTADVAGGLEKKMLLVGAAITAGFAAVIGGAVKVGKALFDIGQEFDDSFDRIRIGTGATGAALAGLEQSFRDVAGAVPSSFEDVSRVIADLSTRTGLTGDTLEGMATQLLTVSRLLGEDVSETVRATTRLFGQFNVPVAEQPALLDKLFRATQASGAGFNELAESVRGSAPALQALGFDLDESIALLARFERDGVSGERVIAAFNVAVRNFAKDGVPLREGLAGIITELQTLDQTAATARGIEIFGRGATDVVDAIRSGKFDVEALYQVIANGDETIAGAAGATDGFRESWDKFKNFLKLQFEPVATSVFANAQTLIANLEPATTRIIDALEEKGLAGAINQLGIEFQALWDEYIRPIWEDTILPWLRDDLPPILIEVGVALGEALGRAFVNALKGYIRDNAWDILKAMTNLNLASQTVNLANRLISAVSAPSTSTSSSLPAGVSRFAEGGIVTRPIFPALVGEAGPEAIIPLDKLPQMAGGGATINITVTAADPQAVVEALRRYVRHNGPLGQVVTV